MKKINGWCLPEFDTLLSKQARHHPHPTTDYQQEIFDAALARVKRFDLAIDVGANVGFHTARLVTRFRQVVAFEPAEANYECLVANTEIFDNVRLFKMGLGFQQAELTLELPADSINCGAYSLKDFRNQATNKSSETVSIVPLDSLNYEPNLIKIDTQGFEPEVLKGSIKTIERSRPVILAEVAKKGPVQQLLDILAPFGYQVVYATNKDKVFAVTLS